METTRQPGSVRRWTPVMIVLVCCFATSINGSAIPMWELLSKDEKINHLYKVFEKQAARFCVDSSSPDCNKNLLIAGLRSLENTEENDLDRMDPYQRGADEIIWRAIVKNNKLATKYGQENSYYIPEDDPLATSENDHNGLGEESTRLHDYASPSDHTGPYLVGPMVIRVFPDGRPVPEDAKSPLPRDEDVEEIKYSKRPSVSEIEANSRRFFYNRPRYDSFAGSSEMRVYVPAKSPSHRNSLLQADKNWHFRRYNPLLRGRTMPKLFNDGRLFRYY